MTPSFSTHTNYRRLKDNKNLKIDRGCLPHSRITQIVFIAVGIILTIAGFAIFTVSSLNEIPARFSELTSIPASNVQKDAYYAHLGTGEFYVLDEVYEIDVAKAICSLLNLRTYSNRDAYVYTIAYKDSEGNITLLVVPVDTDSESEVSMFRNAMNDDSAENFDLYMRNGSSITLARLETQWLLNKSKEKAASLLGGETSNQYIVAYDKVSSSETTTDENGPYNLQFTLCGYPLAFAGLVCIFVGAFKKPKIGKVIVSSIAGFFAIMIVYMLVDVILISTLR